MKRNIDPNLIRKALAELNPQCFKLLYEFWIKDRNSDDIAKELKMTRDEFDRRHIDCRKRFLNLISEHGGNT